jgi:hypothetical protein
VSGASFQLSDRLGDGDDDVILLADVTLRLTGRLGLLTLLSCLDKVKAKALDDAWMLRLSYWQSLILASAKIYNY